MHSTSESLLIRLQAEACPEDWSRFVQLYTPLIFYWARKTGLSQHDAADLVQDVLTIVFQKLEHLAYDPDKSFRGWLRTITLNRHREILRRNRLRNSKTVDLGDQSLSNMADHRQLESTWDLNYGRGLVASAMSMMKEDFAADTWQALQMLVQDGKTAAAVSRETGVSVWTIYSAKNRLMSRLRRELQGLLDDQ